MKKLMFAALAAMAACAPLASRADKDRLNLWPLAGYNDGAFDFIWPLGHFKDSGEWRFFPFIREHGSFCIFPELWFTDNGFAVLPLAADYDFGSGTIFPVVWWNFNGSATMNCIFPAYYYRGTERGTTFWAACGLAGYERDRENVYHHRFIPFYMWDRGDFFSLPYSRYRSDGNLESLFFCGLAGFDSDANGDYMASWLFPLYSHDKAKGKFVTPLGGRDGDAGWVVPFYWRDKKTFASLPYWRRLGEDGEIDKAFSLPLLSGYDRDRDTGDRLLYVLLGLGGRVWNDKTGGASWVFPLYYNDRDSFYTLLYGRNPSRRWLFPIYFEGPETMYVTPLYGRNKKTGADWLFPLYCRDKDTFVSPLYGKSGDTDWLFPLYCREKGRSFYSIPFGWTGDGAAQTNMYFAGGIAGVRLGSKHGGWLFPLFNRKKDATFDKDLARLDSQTIPDDILFTDIEHFRTNDAGKVTTWTDTSVSVNVGSSIRGSVLLVSDHDRSVRGRLCARHGDSGGRKTYELEERSKQGNRIVFNRESSRTVAYDIASRERLGERSSSETMALCGFFCDDRERDSVAGTSHARTRILWKLWDREERNGDVTIDAFPGFTYDTKKNGYSKTSFLWRFFRYENDPEKGKKVDFLFIPVWR